MKKAYQLTNKELTQIIPSLVANERQVQSRFLYYLGAMDQRRLWAELGHPSLFAYLNHGLGYSKGAAYRRLSVGRLAKKHSIILKYISEGRLTLTTASLVAKRIKEKNLNCQESNALIERAKNQSEDQLAKMFCTVKSSTKLESVKPVEVSMLELGTNDEPPKTPQDHSQTSKNNHNQKYSQDPAPSETPAPQATQESPTPKVVPMVEVTITMTQEEYAALKRMQDLTIKPASSKKSQGPQSQTIKSTLVKVVDHWLAKNDPLRKKSKNSVKFGSGTGTTDKTSPPQKRTRKEPNSRYVPIAERTKVWQRDQSQCTYVSADQQRCPAKQALELDHIKPFGQGGRSDKAENLRLRCRAHNHLAAEQTYGKAHMAGFLRP
jgi:hypothetical protein